MLDAQNDRPTLPPPPAEHEDARAFERDVRERGEPQARLSNVLAVAVRVLHLAVPA